MVNVSNGRSAVENKLIGLVQEEIDLSGMFFILIGIHSDNTDKIDFGYTDKITCISSRVRYKYIYFSPYTFSILFFLMVSTLLLHHTHY